MSRVVPSRARRRSWTSGTRMCFANLTCVNAGLDASLHACNDLLHDVATCEASTPATDEPSQGVPRDLHRRAAERLPRVARSGASVLIRGETIWLSVGEIAAKQRRS